MDIKENLSNLLEKITIEELKRETRVEDECAEENDG